MAIPVHLVGEGIDWPAWIQAGGSIAAILVGFGSIWLQSALQRRAAGRAGMLLARNALTRVTDRFEAMLGPPTANTQLLLRGDRANEMVAVLRELDVSTLPPKMIEPIATIRSSLYAINRRIDEIYRTEEKAPERRAEREKRLKSSGVILIQARRIFADLFRRGALGKLPEAVADYLLKHGETLPLP